MEVALCILFVDDIHYQQSLPDSHGCCLNLMYYPRILLASIDYVIKQSSGVSFARHPPEGTQGLRNVIAEQG